ncbi:MAG: nucleotidyltransferase domain-containing protein [Trueperaceae bacterium]|nr:nucleotidyltransferase domain-containing protein [Trueperaceae bacterium]
MRDIALRAVEELKRKYDPEFIILYGSVARADFTEDSDIDLAVFCKVPGASNDVRVFEGKQLDCWIYLDTEAKPENNGFLRLAGGELVLDKNGAGKRFLDGVNAKFQAGPAPVTPDSREHLVEWSKKTLKRAEKSDIEAKYRQTELLFSSLELYFKLRDLWFTGPKNSFKWLEANDNPTYKLFEAAFADPTNLDKLRHLTSAVSTHKQISTSAPDWSG